MLLSEITQSTLLKVATELSIQIQDALKAKGAHNIATVSAHATHVVDILGANQTEFKDAACVIVKFQNKLMLTRAAVMRVVRDTVDGLLKDNDVLGIDYKIIERKTEGKVELFAARK